MPKASGGRRPNRITSFAETPIESAPMIEVGWQKREANLERAIAEDELQVQR